MCLILDLLVEKRESMQAKVATYQQKISHYYNKNICA